MFQAAGASNGPSTPEHAASNDNVNNNGNGNASGNPSQLPPSRGTTTLAAASAASAANDTRAKKNSVGDGEGVRGINHVYYTLADVRASASDAFARAPGRKETTAATLRVLGLEAVNGPTWPPVSVFAADGPRRDIFDPTTCERLASIRSAEWQHVDAALTRMREAQRRWAALPGNERVAIVMEVNNAIHASREPLATLLTLEIGKIPSESAGELAEIFEVAESIQERAAECGGAAPHVTRRYESKDATRRALGWFGEERALPLGIVGKVTAFNFPYAVFGWGALPALAAGNGVIWKPHPNAALTAMAMARTVDAALARRGFSGLVCCVDVADHAVTRRMWADPRVGVWEATGGEEMGVALLHTVADARMTRTVLELSGNNAVVVAADADVAQAVESCLFGTTGTAGQRCTSTRVVYVHGAVFDEFERLLVAGYKSRVRVGDPLMPGVNMGPVHHRARVAAFEAGVAAAVAAGSTLLCGGGVLGGNFVEPTLLRAPGFRHAATAHELFSPVAHLVRYEEGELGAVVDDINRTGYGLSGGVFTADMGVFERLAAEVRVGILNLNYGSSGAEAGENFGGEGRTGGGRMMGPAMFTNYTRYVNSMRAPHGGEVVHAQGVTQN